MSKTLKMYLRVVIFVNFFFLSVGGLIWLITFLPDILEHMVTFTLLLTNLVCLFFWFIYQGFKYIFKELFKK